MELRIATCTGQPGLSPDDEGLLAALAEAGVDARLIPWQNLAPFGAPILIRTPWDYTHFADNFRAWLEAIETANTVCINPAKRMLWNMDKRYLLELQEKGHAIVPSQVMQSYSETMVRQVARAMGWTKAIVKPITGCSAEGLVLLDGDEIITFDTKGNTWAPQPVSVPEGPCLLQPFLPEILQGEWSLFYFDGNYSHAVIKTPAEGDIRIQEEHGGKTKAADPPNFVREAADAIAAELDDCTYARVDGVVQDGRFLLMELELIEPELYFRYAKDKMAVFAQAVAQALQNLHRPKSPNGSD